MNILLREKQTVHEQGDFKPETGMELRGMTNRTAYKEKMRGHVGGAVS